MRTSQRTERAWGRLMGHAYTSGVRAGKRDLAAGRDLREMRATGYQFRGAFLQGYAHGRGEKCTYSQLVMRG